jgi:hypothetical protein
MSVPFSRTLIPVILLLAGVILAVAACGGDDVSELKSGEQAKFSEEPGSDLDQSAPLMHSSDSTKQRSDKKLNPGSEERKTPLTFGDSGRSSKERSDGRRASTDSTQIQLRLSPLAHVQKSTIDSVKATHDCRTYSVSKAFVEDDVRPEAYIGFGLCVEDPASPSDQRVRKVYSASTNEIVASGPVDGGVQHMKVYDGLTYIIDSRLDSVYAVDVETGTIQRVPEPWDDVVPESEQWSMDSGVVGYTLPTYTECNDGWVRLNTEMTTLIRGHGLRIPLPLSVYESLRSDTANLVLRPIEYCADDTYVLNHDRNKIYAHVSGIGQVFDLKSHIQPIIGDEDIVASGILTLLARPHATESNIYIIVHTSAGMRFYEASFGVSTE